MASDVSRHHAHAPAACKQRVQAAMCTHHIRTVMLSETGLSKARRTQGLVCGLLAHRLVAAVPRLPAGASPRAGMHGLCVCRGALVAGAGMRMGECGTFTAAGLPRTVNEPTWPVPRGRAAGSKQGGTTHECGRQSRGGCSRVGMQRLQQSCIHAHNLHAA
jgi:hypothetical protein